jgi:hypothetical protein
MSYLDVYTPIIGATQTLSGTSVSSSVTLTAAGKAAFNVRLHNAGPNIAFVRYGVGAQTAVATTDFPLPVGAVEAFFKGPADTIAVICSATQTATVYVTPGEGA